MNTNYERDGSDIDRAIKQLLVKGTLMTLVITCAIVMLASAAQHL